MSYVKLTLDQNNVYGNALQEYDENGKPIGHQKTWIRTQNANGNQDFAVLELEDE